MKKTYPLAVAGKHPDRVMDAIKHDIRKYLKRERRRPLPEGVDFLDFDCRFGTDPEHAQSAHVSALIGLLDAAGRDGARQAYVEILAKPGHRTTRPAAHDGPPIASDAPATGGSVPADPTGTADT